MPSRARTLLVALAAASTFVLSFPREAAAQSIIKRPGLHPQTWELEPHLNFRGVLLPESDPGFGLGIRATIPVTKNGFISSINNSVGIGFGVDWLAYRGAGLNHFIVPVVLQWNFFLTKSWSVFAEPGLALNLYNEDCAAYRRLENGRYYARSCHRNLLEPHVGVGARWHFTPDMALTLRLANTAFSAGISWF